MAKRKNRKETAPTALHSVKCACGWHAERYEGEICPACAAPLVESPIPLGDGSETKEGEDGRA